MQTCKTYIIASLDFICTMGKWQLVDSTESGLYELPAQLTNSTGVHTEVKADKNGHGTDLVFSLQFFIFEGICLEAIMLWFGAVGSVLDLTWFDVNIRFDLDVNTSDSWIHDPKWKMKNMKKYTLDQVFYIYNCYAVLWFYSEFTDVLLENVWNNMLATTQLWTLASDRAEFNFSTGYSYSCRTADCHLEASGSVTVSHFRSFCKFSFITWEMCEFCRGIRNYVSNFWPLAWVFCK